MKIVVLISGRGSNLGELINNQKSFQIVEVLCDHPEALGLKRAEEAGINTTVLPRKEFPSKEEFFHQYLSRLEELNPDLIVLAGFMRILPKTITDRFFPKMINLHPSLLPKYKGLHTHQRALENQDPEHGCTVHLVNSGIDTGPILAQAALKVQTTDTPDSLKERVSQLEYKLLPWVVQQFSTKDLTCSKKNSLLRAR